MNDHEQFGYYSEIVPADSRRIEFNIKNHALSHMNQTPDFVFIGDSITHFWELNAYFKNQLLVNRGISGDTTTYLKKRFYTDAIKLQPKYIVLNIGINDSLRLEGDYWKLIPPDNYESVLSDTTENLFDIIQQAKNSSSVLILTSLLPIHIEISLHEPERKRFICDVNQWLSLSAKREGLIFVNYYMSASYPGTNKLLEGITYDGLHPNGKGYDIMAEVLRNTLHNHNISI